MNYNKRKWLNSKKSDSTSSVVSYDGEVTDIDTGKKFPHRFLEISDCRNKIRLHLTSDDSDKDFIKKLQILNNEITKFINYLNKKL
jgi:hypothetical protein